MKKILAIFLMWTMPLSLLASVYMSGYYADARPQHPQPSKGEIYPLNVHGTVVYLTKLEDFAQTWIFNGGLICGIIGGALWRRVQRENEKI